MADIVLGADALEFPSISFLGRIVETLMSNPVIAPGSTSATATLTESEEVDGTVYTWSNIVTFQGTKLDTLDGEITSISHSYQDETGAYVSQILSGLDIDSGDMLAAIDGASVEDHAQLNALFKGINWTLDVAGTKDQTFAFGGTGGDDTVTFGNEVDHYALDGGNDVVNLGGGYDFLLARSFLDFEAAGYSVIDGGKGKDAIALELYPDGEQIFPHGMTIDLSKPTIKFDKFTVELKSFEDIYGSLFTDTLIGTKGGNWIFGNGGGDRIVGGGGGDLLRGGAEIDDFFTYRDASDSSVKSRDTIFGFEHGIDRIDLHQIDPGTKNGAFKFVGEKALKDVGDLHVVFKNGPGTESDAYLIEANLDKDRTPEFQVELREYLEDVSKTDFIL